MKSVREVTLFPVIGLMAMLSVLCLGVMPGFADDQPSPPSKATVPAAWIDQLQWRSIGPANMGGRIIDMAVARDDPNVYWLATASGGLLKTVNNGVTYTHQFDREKVVSIGAVAVAPSNAKILWVGTGEANPRNSVSWGDGVYKSTDGGATWKHMGLSRTFQVGRIVVHPENPDIVYVGALGRLWGHNPERGLFKTADGGKTWKKILFVDEKTGVVDFRMKPDDPETLIVATYERQRDGFDTNDPAKKWGPGSGLYKTTDGGGTFKRLAKGLPRCLLGRIGIDFYAADPKVVYAVIESEKITQLPADSAFMGISGESVEVGVRLTAVNKDGPGAKAGLKKGDVIIRMGEVTVHSYDDFIFQIRQHKAGDKVKVELSRARKSVVAEVTFGKRPGGDEKKDKSAGKQPEDQRARKAGPFSSGLGGQRENIQGQQGPEGYDFGGVFRSDDAGETWHRINSVNPRPMYYSQIRVDPGDSNFVYVLGTQLYRSTDGGKTFSPDGAKGGVHVDHHALWIDPRDGRHIRLGNDGGFYVTYDRMATWAHHNTMAIGQFYHVTTDYARNYRVYGGMQDNGSWGGPNRVADIDGPRNEDWRRVGGGDGFVCAVDRDDPDLLYCESQGGFVFRQHLKTGDMTLLRPVPPKGRKYRFNWNTPFLLSHHNTKIFYSAGNHVFRSYSMGKGLKAISPEISATNKGSATALAESPVSPDVLYVGTDDGGFWMTADGGVTWIDLFELPPEKKQDSKQDKTQAKEKTKEKPAEKAKPEQAAPQQEVAPKAAAGSGFQRLVNAIPGWDGNGDGVIEKSEAPADAEVLFKRLDGNNDGRVDQDELKAGAARLGVDLPGGGKPPAQAEKQPAKEAKADEKKPPAEQPRQGTRKKPDKPEEPEKKALDQPKEAEKKKPAAWTGQSIKSLLPGRRWVSSLAASRFKAARVYAAFDGHRADDDAPYVFVSEDRGRNWRSLCGNLPNHAGSVRVIKEDLDNENLLFLGTEFGAWVSVDRGQSWTRLNGNLPTVAIHDIALQPASGEIVAATHGRSLWALDATVLRQIDADTLAAPLHLYKPNLAVQWRRTPRRGHNRLHGFTGQNPVDDAVIFYSLGKPAKKVALTIQDRQGNTLAEFPGGTKPGLYRVQWNMAAQGGSGQREPSRGRRRRSRRVPPGIYALSLAVDNTTQTGELVITHDPDSPPDLWQKASGGREADTEFDMETEESEQETQPERGIF